MAEISVNLHVSLVYLNGVSDKFFTSQNNENRLFMFGSSLFLTIILRCLVDKDHFGLLSPIDNPEN